MDFGNFLNLTGVVTMDFEEGLQSLDRFLKTVQAKAIEIEKSFQGIDTKGFSDSLVSIGSNFAIAVGSFSFAKDQMISGFSDLRQAGGDAFDYIGSRAKALAKDAIMASSEMENFNRTLQVHTRNQGKTSEISKKVTDWEITSPWEMVDVQRATRKAVARGIHDPNEVMKYVKLASEMASVNDQDIGKAMDALMKTRARSPEAYRSLKQNFTIGPDQLKGSGVTLDAGDRLRMRTQGDADAVINALQAYYDKTTGMKASEQQATTVIGKWSSLQSEIWRTTAAFADVVAPKVKDLLDRIRELVKSFNNLSPTMKSIIAHFVGFAAAVFTLSAILAPIVGIISTLVIGLTHLTVAAGLSVIGFISLRGAISGLGGGMNVLAGISSALMNIASRAGASAGAVTALSAAAASAGTKVAGLHTILGGVSGSISGYVSRLASTPAASMLTDWWSGPRVAATRALSEGASGIVGDELKVMPNAWRRTIGPGGQGPGYSTRPGMDLGALGLPYRQIPTSVNTTVNPTDIVKTIGVASIVALVVGLWGTHIINAWFDRQKSEGDRLALESRADQAHIQATKAMSGFNEHRAGSMSPEERKALQDKLQADLDAQEAAEAARRAKFEGTQQKTRDQIRAEQEKIRQEEAGRVQASLKTPSIGAGNLSGVPGASPTLPTGSSLGVGAGFSSSSSVSAGTLANPLTGPLGPDTPLEAAKKAMQHYKDVYDALDKHESRRKEMTEKIIQDEKRVAREETLGLITKEQAISKWLDLKKRSIAAGMSEDDVAKVSVQVNTRYIAAQHEELYQKIDLYRQADAAKHTLTLEKQKKYIEQEIDLMDKHTISSLDYQKNKIALGTDATVAKIRAAIAKDPNNAQKVDRLNTVLQGVLAAPLKGKDRVRSEDEEHERSKKIFEDWDRNHSIKLRDDKLAASDLAATGQHLRSKLRLARDATAEQLLGVEKGSKQEEQIRKQLHVTLKNLYLEDKIEFMKIAQEKAQFLRDLAKQTTTRETGLFEYEESRGRRDPARQAELREKSKKEQIAEVREVAKAKIAEIDEQLRKEDLTVQQRKKYIQDRDAARKTRDAKIKDIEQGSGILKQQQEDTKTREDLENQYGRSSNKATALEYRETLLQKRMSQAKSADKVDSIGKTMEQNLKAQYETQASMIDLKEKEDSLNKSQEQAAIISKRAEQDRLKLQETFLQKMQDVTAEMEKQKGMLDKGKTDFTMGGIYNSYEEIVKHDMKTADKFKSQYDTDGGGGTNFDLARSVAAGKLGIPAGSLERTTVDRGNDLGVGGPKNGADIVKAQQDAAARQTMGMPKRIPLRGSASYDAMQAARALDAWGTFPIVPDGIHKTMISGAKGAGSEGTGGDQQITIPVTVNIGGQSYSQTQNQVVKKSAMNYKHPKGGI